ncbi:MAG TPA: Gldg family protein [Patescibacteria group bacterium]|nr:Gldg family protein [Patescibacteria group bacterium]
MFSLNRRTLTGGSLALLGVLLIAVLVIGNVVLRGARIDLTGNRLYTLSQGTKNILADIDEPINLYFYYSDRATQDIPLLRNYSVRVRELLEEMSAKSGGKLRLNVIDPLPFSEDEDRASGFGLQALPVGAAGESVFFGLAGTNSTDGQSVIPFFQPDKEVFLEYDIAKLVHSLVVGKKPAVGVISGLNVAPGFDPATRQMRDGWAFYQELGDLFDLRQINPAATTKIDEEIGTLLLIHPKEFSDELNYAVDQFVMRGGRLVVFVDPYAERDDSGNDPENPQAAMFAKRDSDLPGLFEAWGIDYDPAKVVLDAANALPVQTTPNAPPTRHLAILGLGKDSLSQDEIPTAQLESINFSTAGQFKLAEGSTLKLIPFVQSSGDAMLYEAEQLKFMPDPEQLHENFVATKEHYVVAGRLEGKLKSAFPDRSDEGHIADSKGAANIVLVADTDMLSDRLWVQVQNFFGQKLMNAFANNGDLVINIVDNLAGSADLIGIRGRATSARPFSTVEAIKRQADQRFRQKEQELQKQLADTEQKLNDLQQGKSAESAAILTPEQQAELARFRDDKVRIRKDLRQVRRQLDADIESLGSKLKLVNIGLMPLLLTIGALGVLWWRRRERVKA